MTRRVLPIVAMGAMLVGCQQGEEHAAGGTGPETTWKQAQFDMQIEGLAFDGLVTPDGSLAPQGSDHATRFEEAYAINAMKRAVGIARDWILTDPDDGAAYGALARALVMERKDDLALIAAETAVVVDDLDAALWATLGDARNRAGDLDGSVEAYQRSLELDERGETHGRLAVLRYYQHELDDALDHLRAARRMDAPVPAQLEALIMKEGSR